MWTESQARCGPSPRLDVDRVLGSMWTESSGQRGEGTARHISEDIVMAYIVMACIVLAYYRSAPSARMASTLVPAGLSFASASAAASVPPPLVPGQHLSIADGMSIARVWACRYSKKNDRLSRRDAPLAMPSSLASDRATAMAECGGRGGLVASAMPTAIGGGAGRHLRTTMVRSEDSTPM